VIRGELEKMKGGSMGQGEEKAKAD